MTGRVAILLGGVLIACAAAAFWVWSPSEAAWAQFFHQIEALGPWVGVALIGLMIVHNFVPVPAELIAVTAGAALGVAYGVLVIWLGAMVGAILAFWLARRFGRRVLRGSRGAAQLARFDRFVEAGDWQGLLAVRLIPIISFNLVNYAAGLSGVGWRRFLWTTAIGILPITGLSVGAGAGMLSLGVGPALALVGAVAMTGVVLRWWMLSAR